MEKIFIVENHKAFIVVKHADVREQLLNDMRMHEHERRLVVLHHLQELLNAIGERCVIHLQDMNEKSEDRVIVYFSKGGRKVVNIEGDGPIWMIEDILKQAFH